MENIETILEIFTKELKQFTGAQPTFKIDYEKEEIILVDACSGFLKRLFKNDRILCHLHDGTMSLSYYTK